MQPEPVIAASSGSPFAIASVRSPSLTWSVGPVTEAIVPSARAAATTSSSAAIDSTPRISACMPARLATSAGLPRTTATSTSSRIRFAVSVRNVVAPAPTGSSTTGTFALFAALPASSIASIQWPESVPMFSTRAPATDAISSTSSGAWAMTGSAPIASVAFAVSFMTT